VSVIALSGLAAPVARAAAVAVRRLPPPGGADAPPFIYRKEVKNMETYDQKEINGEIVLAQTRQNKHIKALEDEVKDQRRIIEEMRLNIRNLEDRIDGR